MTASNSVEKLRRRSVEELQGLNMAIIDDSYRENKTTTKMKNTARDTTGFNSWSKIVRRKYSEIQGLLVSTMEKSNIIITVKAMKIKLVKPMKTYKNKIKLLFKYSNKTKY